MSQQTQDTKNRIAEEIVDAGRLLDEKRQSSRAASTLSQHPIVSTFLVLFICFSAIPALIFGAWSLAVSLGALAFVITTIVILVGGALLALLGCLAIAAFSAGVGTAFVISIFLLLRLISNVRTAPDVRTGFSAFQHELQARGRQQAAISPQPSSNGDWVKTEKSEHGQSEHGQTETAPSYGEATS